MPDGGRPRGPGADRLLAVLRDGGGVEVGLVGPEGMAGLPLLLGVRRASVTEAAQRLRGAGLIRYGRGQVTVLDRAGLEAAACECHAAARAALARVFA